jgi:hypothetical protein
MNNGDLSNGDQVQQFKCTICFPHIVPLALIEKFKTKGKKGIIE